MAEDLKQQSNQDDDTAPEELLKSLENWRTAVKDPHPLKWPPVSLGVIARGPMMLFVVGPVSIGNATLGRTFSLVKREDLLDQLRQRHCVWQFIVDGARGAFKRGAADTIKPQETVTMFFVSLQPELSFTLNYRDQLGGELIYGFASLPEVAVASSKRDVGCSAFQCIGPTSVKPVRVEGTANVLVNDQLGPSCVPLAP